MKGHVTYIHHARIIDVDPECKLVLMSKASKVHRHELQKEEPNFRNAIEEKL